MLLVAVLGGLLGILMMIPLRRALIVKQHGILKYPEGTACAEVLKAGASPESRAAADPAAVDNNANGISARTIFTGFGIGLAYKALNVAFKGWRDAPGVGFGAPLKGGSIAAEVSPELLGVGYIIGPRVAAMMFAGGFLTYLVLIPMIMFFGSQVPGIIAPGTMPISEMGAGAIRNAYILYIGCRCSGHRRHHQPHPLHPAHHRQHQAGIRRRSRSAWRQGQHRSPRPGPAAEIRGHRHTAAAGPHHAGAFAAHEPARRPAHRHSRRVLRHGVVAPHREIGSTSNPISGMTIATLMLTCLVFLIVGWTGGTSYITALSVGGIVCIACSNCGTTSQDLKTGFLIGGTPKLQQIAILFGAFASALLMGPILLKLNDNATVYVPIAQ